jgi:hypothetical protein
VERVGPRVSFNPGAGGPRDYGEALIASIV